MLVCVVDVICGVLIMAEHMGTYERLPPPSQATWEVDSRTFLQVDFGG